MKLKTNVVIHKSKKLRKLGKNNIFKNVLKNYFSIKFCAKAVNQFKIQSKIFMYIL